MAYHCLKFNDNEDKMSQCSFMEEDGHCFHCPCYQPFDPIGELSEETSSRLSAVFREFAVRYGRSHPSVKIPQ